MVRGRTGRPFDSRSVRRFVTNGVGTGEWPADLPAVAQVLREGFEVTPGSSPSEPRLHEMSHGESFLEVLRTRFDSPGFYCLDEPEAALSFSGQLALMPGCSRWASGASARRRTNWSWSRTGGATSTTRRATCGT
jgi:hypothetical protein